MTDGARWLAVALAVLVVITVIVRAGGTATADESARRPVTIGSKTFTEGRLLAEIMAQLIEARTDIPVVRRTHLGGTLIVHRALCGGEIDLYPEYTGTGWSIVLKRKERASDPLRTYLDVAREYEERSPPGCSLMRVS